MKEMHEYQIGGTPMIPAGAEGSNRIFIKLEGENFLGSSKSRTGYWIIHDLPAQAKGKTIVESTSGNLGFALGYFCKEAGLDFLALVDDTITKPKIDRLRDAGIAYQMVAPEEGVDLRTSRMHEAQRLVATGNYHWVNQYNNPSGVKAHEQTTGPEIWEQTKGTVTHCVCAMGSCGTICGIGRFFKSHAPKVQICGAEPIGSTIFGTVKAPYLNAGSGMAGKPGNLQINPSVVDRSFSIPDEESIHYAQELYHRFGVSAGITTGLAYAAALRLSKEVQNANIVVLSADGREYYKEYLD